MYSVHVNFSGRGLSAFDVRNLEKGVARAFERTIWQSRKNWRDSWRRVASKVFDKPVRATLEGAEMLKSSGSGQALTPGDRQNLIRGVGLRAFAEFGLKDGTGGKSPPVRKYVGTFARINPKVTLVPGQLVRSNGLDRHGNVRRNLRDKILGWFFNPAGGEQFTLGGVVCNARNLRVFGDGVDSGGPRSEKERADFERGAGFGKPSPPAPGQSRWLVLMPGDPLSPGSRRKRKFNVLDRSIPIATLRGRINRPASYDRILTLAWTRALKQTRKDFRRNVGGAIGKFESADRGARFV